MRKPTTTEEGASAGGREQKAKSPGVERPALTDISERVWLRDKSDDETTVHRVAIIACRTHQLGHPRI